MILSRRAARAAFLSAFCVFEACSVSFDTQTQEVVVNSSVGVYPTAVAADGVSQAQVTVTTRGSNGQAIANEPIWLSSSLSGSQVQQPAASTDANGQAFGAITSTAQGQAVVSAQLGQHHLAKNERLEL